MLRVGFLFRGGDGWLGGVNYLWNLLYAIGRHERAALTAVVLAPRGTQLFGLDQLPEVEVMEVDLPSRGGALPTLERRLVGRDRAVEALCDRARLDVVSHAGTFGWRFSRATLPWIPDLQHRRLPGNFSARELALRVYGDVSQLAEGTATIFSSEAAAADGRRYYGPLARHVQILHFVSQPRVSRAQLPPASALRARHAVPARYLFLPNQFWRHKNHAIVVDALTISAARGVRPVVVLSGKGEDYRHPSHYAELMARVAAAGLTAQFLHLGMVSYEDLMALMRDALAVINPSLFEGWSTTVEEARSLGKATILSSIDVHLEQAPPGATYFAPADADALARAMERAWGGDFLDEDRARERDADAALEGRTVAFAARYRAIVEAAVGRRR